MGSLHDNTIPAEIAWLDIHNRKFEAKPLKEALERLDALTNTINQYLNNPDSCVTKGLLVNSEKMTRRFLELDSVKYKME